MTHVLQSHDAAPLAPARQLRTSAAAGGRAAPGQTAAAKLPWGSCADRECRSETKTAAPHQGSCAAPMRVLARLGSAGGRSPEETRLPWPWEAGATNRQPGFP